MSFRHELLRFPMACKKHWMVSMFPARFVFGGLTVPVKGSAVPPLIHTLF